MKIAFIASIELGVVSGPRNSVTQLANSISINEYAEAVVFSDLIIEPFYFNSCRVEPISFADWKEYDCVVFSGVWNTKYLKLSRTLRGLKVPYIVSPRSSLMKSQFKYSSYKKIPFMLFGGLRFIKKAACIHFLTEDERAASIFVHNYFLCSNSVQTTNFDHCNDYSSKNGHVNQQRTIGYIGRYVIHHKGLDILIRAVKKVSREMREKGWRLEMYGADNRGEKKSLVNLVERLSVTDLVLLHPPLAKTEIVSALSGFSAFVHSSRYEGQPQAVMEAMTHGVPILATVGTNMKSSIESGGFGIVCDTSVNGVAKGLLQLINHPEALTNLGVNAAKFSSFNYSLDKNAKVFVNEISEFICKHPPVSATDS